MGWFSSNDRDRFNVTATVNGWFGPKTVHSTVTGKAAADREARRYSRRGATNVAVKRDGWWAAR